jgi:hypothetical protein
VLDFVLIILIPLQVLLNFRVTYSPHSLDDIKGLLIMHYFVCTMSSLWVLRIVTEMLLVVFTCLFKTILLRSSHVEAFDPPIKK